MTPVPSPTLEPTPAPLLSREGLKANRTIIIPVAVIFIIALILLLVVLTRRPKQVTGTGFLEEMTGVVDPEQLASQYTSPDEDVDPDATSPFLQLDPDATSPVPHMLLPPAMLKIERSRDAAMIEQTVTISHIPFKIGRRDSDLNIGKDDNVSRNHAIITYQDGHFMIHDVGSLHGTMVNGQRLTPKESVVLQSGTQIVIGTTTIISIEIQATE